MEARKKPMKRKRSNKKEDEGGKTKLGCWCGWKILPQLENAEVLWHADIFYLLTLYFFTQL
jgi:hypothetical protein